ncbi:MAG: GNAT family N-acetyltransferase [Sphingomonas sp.]|nr:GNAT family N-acetyltransferase [Sphingomonas sp.]
MSTLQVETLSEPAARAAALPDLARLRIAVFRDWPYLYDGSLNYESEYLAHFLADEGAVLVVARDGDRIVGAATASPMATQEAVIRHPFEHRRHDIASLFYFGESVLLSDYRGHGLGHAFFDAREAAARAAGATAACFCGVVRPVDHPLRPAGARDLSPFWRGRGYAPVEGAIAHYDWKDIDQPAETPHPMQFWMRAL